MNQQRERKVPSVSIHPVDPTPYLGFLKTTRLVSAVCNPIWDRWQSPGSCWWAHMVRETEEEELRLEAWREWCLRKDDTRDMAWSIQEKNIRIVKQLREPTGIYVRHSWGIEAPQVVHFSFLFKKKFNPSQIPLLFSIGAIESLKIFWMIKPKLT